MKVVEPYYVIYTKISPGGKEELRLIEEIGRSCYHSEDKMDNEGESAKRFIAGLIKRGHESVLEHSMLTVNFRVDRGISHQIVRHRLCAFTQESTRYCNYADLEKYPDGVKFVHPVFFPYDTPEYVEWLKACEDSEFWYFQAIKRGARPEEARTMLHESTATSLTVTTNYREWRHILQLRTSKAAHPQIRQVMCPLLHELQDRIPIIFDDIKAD